SPEHWLATLSPTRRFDHHITQVPTFHSSAEDQSHVRAKSRSHTMAYFFLTNSPSLNGALSKHSVSQSKNALCQSHVFVARQYSQPMLYSLPHSTHAHVETGALEKPAAVP